MMKWLCAVAAGAALAACSGGSGGSDVSGAVNPATSTPAPAATAVATLPPVVSTQPGDVLGSPNHFNPTVSDTSAGGTGQTLDSIPCSPTMYEDTFHVHSYLGVLVNGNWLAIPYGIGMRDAGAPVDGFVDTANCFYYIHTHDSSGYIHQESPSNAPLSSSLFTLGNVMDVWGQPLTANSFASWTGLVRVFYGTAPSGTLKAVSYSEYTGDPRALPLYSHEAVWLEVGPPYVEAAQLPPVEFYTQY